MKYRLVERRESGGTTFVVEAGVLGFLWYEVGWAYELSAGRELLNRFRNGEMDYSRRVIA